MKTIELDFDKKDELEELGATLRKGSIKFGKDPFVIRLFISHNISDTTYAAYLFLLVNYFSHEISSDKKKVIVVKEYEKHINELFNRYFLSYDVSKLQNDIEKEFKLNIEMEKKKPTDAVFGIWKNENITIDQIREKAWQRTK